MNNPGGFFAGLDYLLRGAKLLTHPRIQKFVLIPVLANTLLFFALTTYLYHQFGAAFDYLMNWLPGWLEFLAWIIGLVAALLILVVYGYLFSAITNLIAAPFYGVLAERVAQLVAGRPPSSESLLAMIPRVLFRELRKIWYFLWRGLLALLLGFVPVVGPFLTAAWAAWCMSIQYADYAADNDQYSFYRLRSILWRNQMTCLGFGGGIVVGLMVPVLNIIVVPAAVAGGTLFWLDLQSD